MVVVMVLEGLKPAGLKFLRLRLSLEMGMGAGEWSERWNEQC